MQLKDTPPSKKKSMRSVEIKQTWKGCRLTQSAAPNDDDDDDEILYI